MRHEQLVIGFEMPVTATEIAADTGKTLWAY
jgi:hypothetical protein